MRFSKVVLVFGWFMIVTGIVCLVLAGRDAIGHIPGSFPRVVQGLVAIVVGSAIIGWVKRYGTP
jgi:hypothetical protein